MAKFEGFSEKWLQNHNAMQLAQRGRILNPKDYKEGNISIRNESAAIERKKASKAKIGRPTIGPEAVEALMKPKTVKKSKYLNKKVTHDGITFDSMKEYRRWLILHDKQNSGEIQGLRHHEIFSFDFNGFHICNYEADFCYTTLTSTEGIQEPDDYIVEDVKSAHTRKLPVYRLKKKMMRAFYGIEINEV